MPSPTKVETTASHTITVDEKVHHSAKSDAASIGESLEAFSEKGGDVSDDEALMASLMREQDAELLESMHFKSEGSPGGTPLLSAVEPPRLSLSNIDMLASLESSAEPSHLLLEAPLGGEGTLSEPTTETRSAVWYRRCLSGDVRPCPLDEVEDEETTSSPVSVAQEAEATLTIERSSSHARSKDIDRRMDEAAQFAEAVGEMPPTSQNEVCIIEEGRSDDDSDDDDDDDATTKEIRIDVPVQESSQLVETASVTTSVDTAQSPERVRRKVRPHWPFRSSEVIFLDKLRDHSCGQDFVYQGICSNPPEITKRGVSRGNYAQLHRKAWLEVSDKYHRYGKNLRLYYRYWEREGFPTNKFFDWLDSKGEAAGKPLPNLEECPRSVLDSDTVHYISNPDVTDGYALDIIPDEEGRGLVVDVDRDPVKTGSDGWIFVLRDNVMYGAQKITSITGHSKQRFHHSSFFGGKAVAAAGIIVTDENGYLTRLYPHSGHYRPGEAHMQRKLFFIHHKGVNLRTFEVDTQQIFHVARDKDASKKTGAEKGEKKRKMDSLDLKPAVYVACFLAHKARFIGDGIFSQIHKIRRADVTTVTEALNAVDDGGFWTPNEEEKV